MFQKLNIRQKFEDFPSFEIAIQQYQNAENVPILSAEFADHCKGTAADARKETE